MRQYETYKCNKCGNEVEVQNAAGVGDGDCLVCTFSMADRWTENIDPEGGISAQGRTYTQFHLLSGRQYRLSCRVLVEAGDVRVGIEAAGQQTELLILSETSTFQTHSRMFETPDNDRESVPVTVEFGTDTDPARFRLADVAVELVTT